jgi:RNA polymerase sigma factor (sigma-70 family)
MLAAMTEKQREVFVLYHKYGWTQQQIAEYLGLDQTTVRDRLRYAVKKAKKYFP